MRHFFSKKKSKMYSYYYFFRLKYETSSLLIKPKYCFRLMIFFSTNPLINVDVFGVFFDNPTWKKTHPNPNVAIPNHTFPIGEKDNNFNDPFLHNMIMSCSYLQDWYIYIYMGILFNPFLLDLRIEVMKWLIYPFTVGVI